MMGVDCYNRHPFFLLTIENENDIISINRKEIHG